ncbi:MAG: hypothetical protein IKM43_01180 [Clostridia bacterium]|nr:hypothetical protein [Clostridia bacterium]
MSKNKKTSREVKSKVPFNVFRKGAMALAVAGVMIATPLMLTGCAGEKGDVGPQGPAGATWYSGTQYSADQGKVGDFFYDTDDSNIYQKTTSGWTLISNIKGDTGVAKEIEIQATAEYIQWRYEGDANWQNLVSLASLKGLKGDTGVAQEVLIQATADYIQWKYEDDTTWQNLVSLATLKGEKGDAGNEVLLNVTATHIQWKHEGDAEWEDLISLESLKGLKGDIGETGKSAYEIAQDEGFEGTEAEWLESLKGDAGKEVTFNVSTTHIQWKYVGEETWNDLISLESLKGLKGDTGETGKSAYEIALENDPSIGSEVEWLESLKGEKGDTGNGITNMEIVYEYDENGQLWAVFTITYSEGEPQVIRSAVPKKLMYIQGITLGENGGTLQKFAKVTTEEDAPQLYLRVQFDDDTYGNVLLTDDMFTVDEHNGFHIPDFTQEGSYSYKISYMGKQTQGLIEIVNLSNFITPISNVNLLNSSVTTNSKSSDLIVNINYENGESISALLSDVAESYFSYETNESSSELDLTVVGSYEITIKSEFAFKYNPEDEEYATLNLNVYDESCTISYISINNAELTLGDVDFEDKLRAMEFDGWLHKADQNGQYNIRGTVADLTYDLSAFNINRVGIQHIPFTYQLEGETGYYSNYITVSVIADLSEAQAVGTYTVGQEDQNMMMFMMAQGDSITLYDNGVAVITNNMNGGDTMQTSYDVDLAQSGILKMFDSYMNDYSYFTLNDETDMIGFYSVEGETTPTDYTCPIEIMGQLFDATISIYGTEGTCKAKVSILMPKELTGAPEDMFMPYAFVDCVWEDEDTVSSIGRTFNVTDGNVLVEVAE